MVVGILQKGESKVSCERHALGGDVRPTSDLFDAASCPSAMPRR